MAVYNGCGPINPVKTLIRLLCMTVATLLYGCGGGGGGGSSPPPPAPPAPPPATNQPPVATLQTTTVSGVAPLTVQFDAASSTDADGQVMHWAWDFGDGNSAIGESTENTYTVAGDYTATLTVTDDDGATSQATAGISITTSASMVTVSGTVQVLASSAIDSDVNDRFTTPVSNNDFAAAQPVQVPTTLGGFANEPMTGPSGASGALFATGDSGDFYRVNLTGNESILLSVAEASADLDLILWDDTQTMVDSSISGPGLGESLTVATPGDYFIEVSLVAGATNYVLNIGQDITISARPPTRLSDPFVPGEFIVNGTLGDDFDLEARSRGQASNLFGIRNADRTLETMGRAARRRLRLPAHGSMSEDARQRYQTLLAIKGAANTPGVRYAEPNLLRKPHANPNDTYYDLQWHYRNVNLPVAWDTTTGDANVIVAVIDTGVLLAHPDLDNRLVAGYDFISDPVQANDGDGPDADPNDPGDLAFGGSSSFHGTHVAGTIAAESDNAQGVAGVAWQSGIMPLRALGIDGGTTFDVMQAVLYAAGLDNQTGMLPATPADVINLSLGSSFSSQSEQDVMDQVRAQGIIVVASAGNDASSIPNYPAAYNGVVSVAATTISNSAAPYSNSGSTVDVAAPGGYNGTDLNGDGIGDGVISTMGDDGAFGPVQFGYAALSGTSMAAPHVAGIAALMKAIHPGLTPQEFDQALAAGDLTDDLGSAGRDNTFGFGLINAQKAVVAALSLATGQGSDPGPILTASASNLNFGALLDNLDFTVQNVGTGSLTINAVTTDQPWLSATSTNIDADGLGTYTLIVDRSVVPDDGTYTAGVTVDSDANDVTLTAIMQVVSFGVDADAGLHYVILVDGNGISVGQTQTTITGGVYPFSIDVLPGQYQLFAGTDSDDDAFLCDAGEACGGYRTLDSPEVLSVNGNTSGLEFLSEFRVNLGASGIQMGPEPGEQQSPDPSSGYRLTKPSNER